MALKHRIITAALVLMAALASCGRTPTEDEIDLINRYRGSVGENSDDEYDDIGASWLSPEEKYERPDSDDSRIVNVFGGYVLSGDRIYYPAKFYYPDSDAYKPGYAYISGSTGECSALCPDPLCTHLDGSGCEYMNIEQIISDPGSDRILYGIKTIADGASIMTSLCRIDVKNDVVRELLRDDASIMRLRFVSGDKLYYSTVKTERVKSSDGQIIKRVTERLCSFDLNTGKAGVLDNVYGDYSRGEFVFADGGRFWFLDSANGRLFKTDLDFENEKTMFEYESEYQISDFFYDTDESAAYILVRAGYMTGHAGEELIDGYICRIDSEGNCERLGMPSDRILSFYLTGKYIYYTAYDPKEYGESPRGGKCTSYDSAKIYRTDREEMSEESLVFDGQDELFFADYLPVGDNLYLDFCRFMDEGGNNWFRVTGVTARVNIMNNTIKWMKLD